jgi:hypothetical protein
MESAEISLALVGIGPDSYTRSITCFYPYLVYVAARALHN